MMTTSIRWWRISAVLAVAIAGVPLLSALGGRADTGGPQDPVNRYIGAARCKMCHGKAETGDQHGVWLKEKHSQAYTVLASKEAKAYADKRGIADAQKSDQCLKCHVTAFGAPKAQVHASFDVKMGVQCETCHGPGEKHMRERMRAAAKGAGKTGYPEIPAGEIITSPPQKTCLQCHNEESPGFQPFCFHQSVAKIRHLNPAKPRTDAERAAMLVCGCKDTCACKSGCEDGKCGVPAGKDGK